MRLTGGRVTDRTAQLEAEIEGLKKELEEAKRFERVQESSGSAMLIMMEDLNKSQSDILRAKKEWEATFDAISDPLFIHDNKFRVIRANRAYQKLSGLEFQKIIGIPYYEIFPKMDGPFDACANKTELLEGREEEISVTHLDRVYRLRLYPIKTENGEYLYSVHILEDVTEDRRAQERTKEEMEVTSHLLMIAEATAHTTDIDRLMEQVVHCGHEILRCDICLSYLWDEETMLFQPAQAHGLSREMIPMFRTEPVDEKMEFVRRAMEGMEPVVTPPFAPPC